VRPVKLTTCAAVAADGQPIPPRHVAWVEIPPLPNSQLPNVVLWGTRTFVRDNYAPDAIPVYREAFAVASLTPSPGLPDPTGATT